MLGNLGIDNFNYISSLKGILNTPLLLANIMFNYFFKLSISYDIFIIFKTIIISN